MTPEQIEKAISSRVDVVREGRVAAFDVEVAGRGGLGIAAEVGRSVQKLISADALADEIHRAAVEARAPAPSVIVLLEPGALPEHAPGRPDRTSCARRWLEGSLQVFAAFESGRRIGTGAVAGSAAVQAIEGETELALAAIWREVLGQAPAHASDNFFALGGSSLAAAQIRARIDELFGVSLPLEALFKAPSLRALGRAIEQTRAGNAGQLGRILPRSTGTAALASPAQRRMWLAWQLAPESAAYDIAGALRLRGALDIAACERAFSELSRRHESLRTCFEERDGELFQQVRALAPFPLEHLDATRLSDAERATFCERLASGDAQSRFDLGQGPLFRARLIRFAADDHLLAVRLHHSIADGWSMNVLVAEFSELYSAFVRGGAPELPALPIQYADYAVWQARRLAQGEEERQLAYWLERLGREHPVLELPLDRPRPHTPSFHGASVDFQLAPQLCQELRARAEREQVTPFMLLLTAFGALLYRYGGQNDLRIGIVSANRLRRETEGLIGLFVNTQVLRLELDGAEPLTRLLRQVKARVIEAQAHAELPFERLVEALQPERSAGVHPLFQVLYNHQRRDLSPLAKLPGVEAELLRLDGAVARFDLALQTEEDAAGRISGSFVYATDLFERSSIERLGEHFTRVVAELLRSPPRALEALDLSDAETGASSESAPARAPFVCVAEQIRRRASQNPDAVALSFGSEQLRYRELEQRANRLAQRLIALGAGPDRIVGIALSRSLELVVSVLAVAKAGAAYLPLDPELPERRWAELLADSGANLVLTERAVRPRLPVDASWRLLTLDELDLSGEATDAPRVAVHPDHLAYVLYTSGSTGKPKAVANTQGALAERLAWMQNEYRLSAGETLLHKTPLGFDVSVWELFWPLLAGARLVVAAPGEHKDPRRLLELIRRYGVSTIHFVPSMLELFVHELVQEPRALGAPSLRRVFSGGEALSVDLQRQVLAAFPAARFDNRYGPTEALINATYWTCREEGRPSVPIGHAIPGTEILILDADLNRVPLGVAGELYIGGSGLARGYTGQPGLSAERFVPHPFAAEPGARLYRSGDRARRRGDGSIEFLGRADQQVKIRGVRIELGEIEARLRQAEGVGQALVMARPGPAAGPVLVAYVTGALGAQGCAELERWVAQRLPPYLVPARILWLEALPLLPSGKLDRKALPEPIWEAREVQAPVGALQERLAEIWRSVLRLERVGRQDDFFTLGGHSLLATQVVARVRQAFDVELPLRALFEASRLDAFALSVEQALARGEKNAEPPLVPVPRTGALPLSTSQERMWFLWSLEREGAAYNVGGAVRLRGALDQPALARGLRELVLRHEALRTIFPSRRGVPEQQILADAPVLLERLDLQQFSPEERERAWRERAHAEVNRPFDLERGPLLRVCLIALEPEQHVLVVTLHHIIAEGWAMEIFAREWSALYEAFTSNQPSPLPALAVQYVDFAVWQRRWLASGVEQRQLEYWKAQLAGEHPVLALPSDRPRPAVQSFRGDGFAFALDRTLSERLRAFAAEQGLTLFMTLSAALLALLHRHSGQSDLRIGYPIANRTRPELEGLIGAFLNTQVLRCEVAGELSARELFARVKRALLDAHSNQDVAFHRIVEAVQPPRSASHTPLFQVICNVQRWAFQQTHRVAGLTLEFLPNDSRTTKFDLMLDVSDVNTELRCLFTYSTDLFERDTIERLSRHFVELLGGMLAEPEQRIARLPMTTSGERRLLLESWNDTARPLAAACIHERIAASAARVPDAPALRFEGRELSHRELEERTNQLARRLHAAGVGPDVLVGVYLERSLDLVVALLGILKAGGAYVPLDPDLPAERLAYMLQDARPRLLITRQSQLESLPAAGPAVWCVDRDGAELAHESSAPLPNLAHPENLAYCIYTSGSTGRPKGVGVRHAALVNFLSSMSRRPGLDAGERILGLTPLSFDIAGLELWLPLLLGACVCVVPRSLAFDAGGLIDVIVRERIGVVQATPTSWRLLAEHPRFAELAGVRALCGGEALPPDLGGRLIAQLGSVWNMYGPTETTIWSTMEQLTPEQPMPLLGRPIDNTGIYILDAELEPVPVGVAGELYIGGEGLARGYHGRAALTAERFLPHPHAQTPGERMYRTGDAARYGRDGVIEYLGRLDQQVKIRGHRIELGEIETRVLEQPGVRAAVVTAPEIGGRPQLVTYLVPEERGLECGTSELVESLKSALRRALPDYMVPAHVVLLGQLPLTPNGKVDRKALPIPEQPQAAARFVGPSTEPERKLTDIWQRVLGVERIGVNDNFFDLGGDSILSLQVVTRALEAGIALAPRDIFQHQTIEQLAAHAVPAPERQELFEAPVSLELTPEQLAALPVGMEQIERISRLSPMQQGMLFQTLYAPEAATYINQLSVEVRGLDPERFEAAWQGAVARHDILRTGFVWGGEVTTPVQVVYRRVEAHVEQLDWSQSVVTPERLEALHASERARGIDLLRPPLQRLLLVRLDSERHRLIWTKHHIVLDGWSAARLMAELIDYVTGQPLPPASSFARYLAWLDRQDPAASERFWRERLGQVTEPSLLMKALPHAEWGTGAELETPGLLVAELDAARSAQLTSFVQHERVTLNTLLQAAWTLVLQAYTGQRTVVFGATVSGRPPSLPGVDGMLGLFINTLPIVQTPDPRQSVGDWLRALQDENLALREHEQTPLHELQRWGAHGGRALFDSLLVFENYPMAEVLQRRGRGALAFGALGGFEASDYPFTLAVRSGDTLQLEANYRRAELDGERVAELLARLTLTLERLAEDGARVLGRLELVPDAERHTLRAFASPEPAEFRFERCLHQLFEERAAAHPADVALIFEEQTLSYGELNARANRLARQLIELGVRPDGLVGIAVERSFEMLVGLLAILKAGAAYVPIDPEYPAERLTYLLEDSAVGWVLTQERFAERFATSTLPVWRLDRDAELLDGYSVHDLPHHLHADSLAYCIYTSGSTGLPKGAGNTHAGLVQRLCWMQRRYAVTRNDVILQKAPFTFDVSVWELFLPLLVGARLVLASPGDHKDPERLVALVRRHGVSIIHFVPSMLRQFLAFDGIDSCRSLVHLFSGGEALTPELAAQVFEALRSVKLHNRYGPTEALIFVSHWDCSPAPTPSIPIGVPVADTAIHLLDAELRLVPVGVAGELYISGVGLARGYHRRPGLTAAHFVPNPFGPAGDRLYRTGDIARWRADGVLEYAGRRDQQVKVRGFRIELGEIEARLAEQPAVQSAAVIAREVAGNHQLVGYVVARPDALGDDLPRLLEARLRELLPEYMVPAQLVVLDSLPLSASGKLDLRALPAPAAAHESYLAPETDAERTLARIWQDVLRLERVGARDNFFELGGDSISSLQVIGRARQAGLALTPKDMFQHPTLGDLGRAAERAANGSAELKAELPSSSLGRFRAELTRLAKRHALGERPMLPSDFPLAELDDVRLAALGLHGSEIDDVYALSPMQEGMLLHTLLEPSSGIYLMQSHYRIDSALDPQRFHQAWRDVALRHEPLRAEFHWQSEGRMLQIIRRHVEVRLDVLDWRLLSEEQRAEELSELMRAERAQGFDLARAPLWHLRLIRVAEQSHHFVLSSNHILMDAWSRSLLLEDVFAAYHAAALAAARPLGPQFRDFIAWVATRDSAAARQFWRAALAGFDLATPLPFDRQPDGRGGALVGDVFERLTEAETRELGELSREHGLTPNTFLQAAWALTLVRFSGQREVLFGVTVAGRPVEVPEMQKTIGLFINSIPLRLTLPEARVRVKDWLVRLLDQNVAMREHEYLPLVQIQAESEMDAGEPLFHSLLVFENAPLSAVVQRNARRIQARSEKIRTHTNYPITVVLYPGPELKLHLSYDARLFEETSITAILLEFKRLLLELIGGFQNSVGALPLTSAVERHRVLEEWNQTAVSQPFEQGYAALFEEQVRRHPERMAAACAGESLPYATLNARANQVAHALHDRGIGLEAPVVVLAERNLDLLIFILGILKAGAVYVPLATRHPAQRLREIIEKCSASAALTTAELQPELARALAPLPAAHRPELLTLEAIRDAGGGHGDLPIAVSARSLAYMIHTSGSTGLPKGAMVEMAGMLNNQLSKLPYLGLGERDVIAQTAAASFDISVWQFLTALLCGGRVEIVPEDVARDGAALLAYVNEKGITVLQSVPSLIQSMLAADPVPLPRLRYLLPTGEALSPALARQWFERYPQIPLVNAYGPAECSDDVALQRLTEPPSANAVYLPIGYANDNNRLYVLDAEFEPVPIGVVGELCVAGIGVGRGYVADPKGTAERFVPNPFAREPGERLYRTSDLVRRRPDGALEFVGRADHQVKLRGYRIELGEVEARLLEHERVREAVAVVHEARGGKHLIGYVVAGDGSAELSETLRTYLRRSLPEYMVPAQIVVLERLPLSANGKIDRKALPDPEWKSSAYVAPRSELEQVLARIWQEMLGVERVGTGDNFFELGGHSLSATQMVSRAQKELATAIQLRDIFEERTLERFAARVEASRAQARVGDDEKAELAALLAELEDAP